ncbi:MAG: recombination protein RmuC [Patescibacteria group bacterium]|jgi:DNA recombination protein RmuC|nr:recombination protein RmuC [Patescibacteria group bacterium]
MTILYILLGLVVGYIIFTLINKNKKEDAGADKAFRFLADEMKDIRRTLDERLRDSGKEMMESLKYQTSESQKLIREITREITEVKETSKQVMNFTDQLQELQNMLKNPKSRGILGEYYLETLLKNTLPPDSYQMQYGFNNGEIVDAAVFIKDKIIPIDSKFSLENYNKVSEAENQSEKERLEKVFVNDLKNRILETSKYIRPEEGTMDFAFMFIPHEAIYYDLLVNKIGAVQEDTENLIQRAASKYKVVIVSPTSFLAYLQTVLQGLKAMQIEEKAAEIQKRVGELGKHLQSYAEYHDKLGKNLGTVVNQYNLSSKEFKKIDKDVMRISGESMNIEILELDKPKDE